MAEPKKLITISMKGGVGKTTLSVGFAKVLQRRGLRVGLLDVDIHGSALPRALNITRDPGYTPILGGKLRPVRHNGMQVFSIGLLFKPTTANMWDGKMKASAVEQIATTSIAWDEDLDWLVVDTPPTSGDEIQALLAHLSRVHGAVIVTQPNELSLQGMTKTLGVLTETQTPVCGILANMMGYTCPHCGQMSNPFDRELEDVEAMADDLGVPYLGAVPFAGENSRLLVLEKSVDMLLARKPIKLQTRKGGVRSWLLRKALQI